MVIFNSYVKLPEGIWGCCTKNQWISTLIFPDFLHCCHMLPLYQPDKFLDQPIASGKRLQFATLKMVIEIDGFSQL